MLYFADRYFERVNTFEVEINKEIDKNLSLIVVIPTFNEPEIVKTLQSLLKNKFSGFSVEIIFVVNSAENSSDTIKNQNLISINQLEQEFEQNTNPNLHQTILHFPNLPEKKSGVGVARKIGMDTALTLFQKLNKPNGIIVSLDADTLVESNYFQAIYNHFAKNKTQAANIAFAHPTSGTDFDENIYQAITIYELYLRYYYQALKYCGFPYFYHTIGSAFCCTAQIYAKQGGMVLNQSGEDFYFLQKIIPVSNFSEIKTTTVFPSPRITDRVVFGTGIAVKQIIEEYKLDFPVYNFNVFDILKDFFDKLEFIYDNKDTYQTDNKELNQFLKENNFKEKVEEIKNNVSNFKTFKARFFNWFSAFRVIKFLNFCHNNNYKKSSVVTESQTLLKKININSKSDIKSLLKTYRNIQM